MVIFYSRARVVCVCPSPQPFGSGNGKQNREKSLLCVFEIKKIKILENAYFVVPGGFQNERDQSNISFNFKVFQCKKFIKPLHE